jgi:hypothetical protein
MMALSLYELSELSIDEHADVIIEELRIGVAAWDDASSDGMSKLRQRLMEHIDAAQERGKAIRDMFTMED